MSANDAYKVVMNHKGASQMDGALLFITGFQLKDEPEVFLSFHRRKSSSVFAA